MSRVKGNFNISSVYNVTSRKPFDTRSVVQYYNDLVTLDTWIVAETNASCAYSGMLVAVVADEDLSKNGLYILIDTAADPTKKPAPNVENPDNWIKIATLTDVNEAIKNIPTPEADKSVEFFNTFDDLPDSDMSTEVLYVVNNTNTTYRWTGTEYVRVGGSDYTEIQLIDGGTAASIKQTLPTE